MRSKTKLISFGIIAPIALAITVGSLFANGAFGGWSLVDDVLLPFGALVIPVVVAVSTSYAFYSGSSKSCFWLSALFPAIAFSVIFTVALIIENSVFSLGFALFVFLYCLPFVCGAGAISGLLFVLMRYAYRRFSATDSATSVN